MDQNVNIRSLATDRHTTITAEMRKKYPSIIHQYDVWHLWKWVTKKLTKKAKKKAMSHFLNGLNVFPAICGGVHRPVVVMLKLCGRGGYSY